MQLGCEVLDVWYGIHVPVEDCNIIQCIVVPKEKPNYSMMA